VGHDLVEKCGQSSAPSIADGDASQHAVFIVKNVILGQFDEVE